MQSYTRPVDANQAPQACASCKMRKRRCDKEMPKCSSCLKKGLKCDYSKSGPDKMVVSDLWPYPFPTAGEENRQSTQYVDFPTMFFLDRRVLEHGQLDIPRATIVVPANILQLVGDVSEVRITATKFFKTIHRWMPIISKKRFYDHHLNPLFHSRADLVLLFLCMKLIMEVPTSEPGSLHPSLYHSIKHFHLEVEGSGILSIQVLQAGIFLSLYEVGHAIYPAAFLSIGACARFAYALGINSSAKSSISKVTTLVELEERRRVWWAIVILDRFVNIGCPGRPFATEDPELHDLLPTDDTTWDQGVITSGDSFTLSSPLNGHMSKFALLCQAARLLGQILSHVSRDAIEKDVVDKQNHDEDEMQLNRTIIAMITASEALASPDYDQIAFCYCALIALHESWIPSGYSRITDLDRCQRAMIALENTSRRIADCLDLKIPLMIAHLENASPWGLQLSYRAYLTYMRLSQETENLGTAEDMRHLKLSLTVMDARWKASGAYLRILEAREAMGDV